MTGLIKHYKTNNKKEIEGVEITFPEAENVDGTVPTFIISRMGSANKAYTKELDIATKPYRRHIQVGAMKEEVAESIFIEVFVNTVLKGWKHVQDADGIDIPFTKQTAISLLNELPDVYKRLMKESQEIGNFRDAGLEDDSKNS